MKHAWRVCLGSLLLVVSAGCGSSEIISSGTTLPYSLTLNLTSPQELVDRGDVDNVVRLKRPDGVEIDAWAIRHKTMGPGKGTVVLLHGEGEWKYYYLGVAEHLTKAGYDAVLVDLRSHGWSTGKYITGGAKEKDDVKAVVDAFVEAGTVAEQPITVFGVTYGGATAIQYAAIDPRVTGIMVMAPWASMHAKARRDLGALAGKDRIEAELAKAGEMADFDPAQASAVRAAATLSCPVYIAHGVLDMAVPVTDSEHIYRAIPHDNKRLQIIVPGSPETFDMVDFDGWRAKSIIAVAERTFEPGRTSGGVSQDPPREPAPPAAPDAETN